jgi:cellulose synthase (UDP-forming)
MVVIAGDANRAPYLPPINGPTVGVIANPNDPLSSILLIAGRSGEEVVTAATSLVLGSRALGSDVAVVQPAVIPGRSPYDAPNWINTGHPVKLGELVDAADLQSYGYTGLLHAPFRTAPDFYTWRDRPFALDLRYRSPPGPVVDVAPSRLDVGINGIYLNSFSLAGGNGSTSWFSRLIDFGTPRPIAHVDVPTYDVFGYNDLQFFFDARPIHRGDCIAIPDDLRMGVDPDSTIDLSRGYRFTEMPNLQYFVNSGFPFTRMADFSETAVVLPDRPSAVELTAFLNLMGRIGSLTGYPPVRMMVIRPDGVGAAAGRDVLVMGTLSRLQGIDNLLVNSAVSLQGNRMSLRLPDTLDSVRRVFVDSGTAERGRAAAGLQAGLADGTTLIVGAQSPLSGGRSMIAMLAGSPQALEAAVTAMKDPDQAPLIQGDLSLVSQGQVTSYRVTTPYTVGSLPFWLYPSWVVRGSPYGIIGFMLIGCVLVGLAFYWSMRRRASGRLDQSQLPQRPTPRPTQRPLGR